MHMYTRTPMSTCGCQLWGEQHTSCSVTQNTDIPSVRLFASSLCHCTFVSAKFSPTCALLVPAYLCMRMNENGRIDYVREREGEREKKKIGYQWKTREDNPISVPASPNPEAYECQSNEC